jgi:hypothetical protein
VYCIVGQLQDWTFTNSCINVYQTCMVITSFCAWIVLIIVIVLEIKLKKLKDWGLDQFS